MNIIDVPSNLVVFLIYITAFGILFLIILSVKAVNFFKEIYLGYLEVIQNVRTKKAEKDLKKGRAVVLYLRPFYIDGIKHSEREVSLNQIKIKGIRFNNQYIQSYELNLELELLRSTQKIGPFISIGDPKRYGDNFGAARFYFENAVWKDNAQKYMEDAIMILVRISLVISDGFAWEITQIKNFFLSKTVFFLDIPNVSNYNSFLEKISIYNLYFPTSFDEMKKKGCYIGFDENENRLSSFALETNSVYLTCKRKLKKINKS